MKGKGSSAQQISWPDVLLHSGSDDGRDALTLAGLLGRRCRIRRGTRQRQAHDFDGGRHGIGGVHATASPGRRTRVLLEVVEDVRRGCWVAIWVWAGCVKFIVGVGTTGLETLEGGSGS